MEKLDSACDIFVSQMMKSCRCLNDALGELALGSCLNFPEGLEHFVALKKMLLVEQSDALAPQIFFFMFAVHFFQKDLASDSVPY